MRKICTLIVLFFLSMHAFADEGISMKLFRHTISPDDEMEWVKLEENHIHKEGYLLSLVIPDIDSEWYWIDVKWDYHRNSKILFLPKINIVSLNGNVLVVLLEINILTAKLFGKSLLVFFSAIELVE